jgi:hypothetical protein
MGNKKERVQKTTATGERQPITPMGIINKSMENTKQEEGK